MNRDQALISALFEAGGRIIEVLGLKKENFKVYPDEGYVEIVNMTIVKRWQRDSKTGVAKSVMAFRNLLQIPLWEPLTPYMVNWLDYVDDWLFPSYAKGKHMPMTETRAYQIVRSLGERIGLVDEKDESGKVIKRNHVHPHWFRAQRASQLASEYHWRTLELKEFFGWKTSEMPTLYATLAPADLFERMRPERIKYSGIVEKVKM